MDTAPAGLTLNEDTTLITTANFCCRINFPLSHRLLSLSHGLGSVTSPCPRGSKNYNGCAKLR